MSKLSLIQCGVGGMGKVWWKNATGSSPDFELSAIVDVAPAALAEAGDALNIPTARRFKSLSAALRKVQADAILTVTPPMVHVRHAKLAFARGLHVLTEKPIAHTLSNARRMVELANRAGKQLMVAQNYRFKAAMQTLRRVFAEKPLGEFGHGHIDFYIGADFTGSFREKMPYPLLVDMAIHHLDLIHAVTGRNIETISATSFRPAWSWYDHEPALKLVMQLDDGTRFSYSGDWTALGHQTTWCGDWRLQCERGSIRVINDEITVAQCQRWGKEPQAQSIAVEPVGNEQARLLADFAQAIRSGAPAETNGADNLWSFAAVIAGVTSAKKSGLAVSVGKLLEAHKQAREVA